jgi:uncharacterized membrane protein YphA (DoxX/SURF4 family)
MTTMRRARRGTRTPGTRWAAAALAAFALVLVFAADAAACPACFGETDDAMTDGARWSIAFLGALVYLLIGGGLAVVLALRRRVRRLQDPRRGLRLVHPGTPS